AKARDQWNALLGRYRVEDPDIDAKRTFYSALYRTMLFPRMFHEVDADGRTIHYSPYDGKVHPGPMFTDNGFWDTFRAVFPLFALMH
ncbi:glycoside hydrolase family 92 protein, partial [Escherichia coli]|nr:glycoside hydrolase family 92 protein [Escherichia coli]